MPWLKPREETAPRLAGEVNPVDVKRVGLRDVPGFTETAVIEAANTATPVKHRAGKTPKSLNPLVPMVNGRLYYTQDDLQRWTADTVFVRGTAVGSYPFETKF